MGRIGIKYPIGADLSFDDILTGYGVDSDLEVLIGEDGNVLVGE